MNHNFYHIKQEIDARKVWLLSMECDALEEVKYQFELANEMLIIIMVIYIGYAERHKS